MTTWTWELFILCRLGRPPLWPVRLLRSEPLWTVNTDAPSGMDLIVSLTSLAAATSGKAAGQEKEASKLSVAWASFDYPPRFPKRGDSIRLVLDGHDFNAKGCH